MLMSKYSSVTKTSYDVILEEKMGQNILRFRRETSLNFRDGNCPLLSNLKFLGLFVNNVTQNHGDLK